MKNVQIEILHKLTDIEVKIVHITNNILSNIYTDEQLQFTLLALEQMNVSCEYLLNNTLKEGLNVPSS